MSNWIKPSLGALPLFGHPLSNGLVGLWLLNEGSGNSIQDLSGNNEPASIVGPTWALGPNGWEMSFDGNDDPIRLSSNPVATGDVISVVIEFTASDTDYDRVFSRDDSQRPLGIRWRSSNVIEIVGWDGTNTTFTITSNKTVNTGDRITVVVTVSSTIVSLYIDGIFDNSTAITNGLGDSISLYAWLIGGRQNTPGPPPTYGSLWVGRVNYTFLYDYPLSASEVAQLYREPFGMFEREPIELWVAATSGVVPSVAPKGPLSHPLCGPFGGPVAA